MEKFMLFFRGSDAYEAGQSPEVLQILTQEMMAWLGVIADSHVSSEKLSRTGKQVSGSAKTIIDGPFGTLSDIIGGCTIIQARDIEQAIEIAKMCPILETNATIEVRPILGM